MHRYQILTVRRLGFGNQRFLPPWVWMALSGVVALAGDILMIADWPATASWLIGLGLGVNFLTTGIAILALARASSE